MQDHGVTYKIESLDVEFTHNGHSTEKTIIIRKFRDGKKIKTVRFGLRDKDDIYEDIREGKQICLDRCYVKNFSLTEYRKVYGHSDHEIVSLPGFSARGAFFEAHRETDFSYSSFEEMEVTEFTNSIFAQGNISFYKSDFNQGHADFSHVNFGGGDVNYQYAGFHEGNINFESAAFEGGQVSFVNTLFGTGSVNFKNVSFGEGDVSFLYAKFGDGDKTFERASFGGGHNDFRKIEFGTGKVDFRLTNFGDGEITFEESEFGKGRINFRRATFGDGDVSFEMVDFGTGGTTFQRAVFGAGKLNFSRCIFDRLDLKGTHLNSYCDFRVAKGDVLDLSNTIVRDVIDFQPGENTVELRTLNISGMRVLGQMFLDWEENNAHALISSQEKTTLREKSIQFHILKEALHNNGQYTEEDHAYVAFKRFELKAQREKVISNNKWNAIWFYPSFTGQWLVFDKAGLYATNPLRVLSTMVVVYIAFSLAFVALPEFVDTGIECSGADHHELSQVVKAFYYSAITFTTVGYGDCLPSGMIKLLAGAEGWVGVFLMSYFTVAFVRRILR